VRTPAVVARGLQKRYGDVVAVAGIDLNVEAGICFGFLGPNGAGKTSTMQMIQALAPPSAGLLKVLDLDPATDGKQVRARIGVCPQQDNLDPDLTVLDNLARYAGYFGIERRQARRRSEELVEFVALGEKSARRIDELSGGMKRRLTIARALVNRPELLILDEPTTGLDPQARHAIWQKLRELRDHGITMILTTHYMDEAERLCDRLVVMDHGIILAEGRPQDLIASHVGREVVELRITEEREAEVLDGIPLTGQTSERAGDLRLFFFEQRGQLTEQLRERAERAHISYLSRQATLEDVFLRLTGRELVE